MTLSYWGRLLSYHSTELIQKKLFECYKELPIDNINETSYNNCYRFIYFLKHGENFFKQAEHSPYSIQPMLLFYGVSQLIKACLLTVDPNYPETSSVLAHGVSSRKRKKQQYSFLKDEVKIQKNGLFPHIAKKLYNINHLETEKYSMEYLFKHIAEMDEIITFHTSKSCFNKVEFKDNFFILTDQISQHYHLSAYRFAEYLCDKYGFSIFKNINNEVYITKEGGMYYDIQPFSYNMSDQLYYLPSDRDSLSLLPELLSHYLILYNLSMISRYETEWWYDLLLTAPNSDYPFILRYLEIVKRKIPFFVYEFLKDTI
ncbi:YaaC family protein [Metabacillus malikii]|uniref:YaaC-like Protein n=1 Tax=Metabacillus malikii TaxID=1504265 RepID=A0ABT9ZQP9_9BACI|nr:YaaC family protein [Metabacillus malikii]MDQ0233555.1 hypothetical protein [Metabacillus malikii]